jgi:hypothetical protein
MTTLLILYVHALEWAYAEFWRTLISNAIWAGCALTIGGVFWLVTSIAEAFSARRR